MNGFLFSKRLIVSILAAALLASMTASAQTKEEKRARKDSLNAVKMEGAHLSGRFIKLDGVKLDDSQRSLLLSDIDELDFNEEWKSFEKNYKVGQGLAIGGTCLTVAGAAAAVVGLGTIVVGALVAALGDEGVAQTGGAILLGGAAGAAAGIGTTATGAVIRKKAVKGMKSICDGYNNAEKRVEKELILGGTSSGVGIAFNF